MTKTTGKLALVTGGNRGLGKDIAITLGRNGLDVILTYRSNEQEARAVTDEIRALGRKCAMLQFDVSKFELFDGFLGDVNNLLRDAFERERIDYLINNAGFGKSIAIDELTHEDFDAFVNVHFKGVVFLTQKALRMMNDGGGVVFVTAAGDRYNVPNYAAYAACKGAIEVFSRYVAKEYGTRGIRANTVAPGGIVTDFNNAAIRSNSKAQEWIIAQTPMGRLGEAHDIGGIVGLLCSDESRWLTGQRLEATGGFNL